MWGLSNLWECFSCLSVRKMFCLWFDSLEHLIRFENKNLTDKWICKCWKRLNYGGVIWNFSLNSFYLVAIQSLAATGHWISCFKPSAPSPAFHPLLPYLLFLLFLIHSCCLALAGLNFSMYSRWPLLGKQAGFEPVATLLILLPTAVVTGIHRHWASLLGNGRCYSV